jgi:hypothetical protein
MNQSTGVGITPDKWQSSRSQRRAQRHAEFMTQLKREHSRKPEFWSLLAVTATALQAI